MQYIFSVHLSLSLSFLLEMHPYHVIMHFLFQKQTGMSGNLMILAIIYQGGLMMSGDLITVGELSSFLMYAAFVGVSVSGK